MITDPWCRDHCTIFPKCPLPPLPPPGASSIGGHRKGANWTKSGPRKMLPLPPPMFLLPPRGQTLEYLPHPLHHCPPGTGEVKWAACASPDSAAHHQEASWPGQGSSANSGYWGRGGAGRHSRTLMNSVAIPVPKQGFGPAHFAQLLLLAVLRTTNSLPSPARRPIDPSPFRHRNRQV